MELGFYFLVIVFIYIMFFFIYKVKLMDLSIFEMICNNLLKLFYISFLILIFILLC